MEDKIIRLFYDNQNSKYTINEISKNTDVSYSYVHRQVEELKDKKFLIVDEQSNRKYCHPNYKNPDVKTSFIKVSNDVKDEFFKQKNKLFFLVEKLIADLPQKTDFNLLSMVLFGSTVKGTSTKQSDIDLFFIVSSKEEYDETIEAECHTLTRGFNLAINPLVSEPTSFINMLKDKKNNVAKDLLKNKIILFGAEKFWELVFEVIE